MSQRSSVLISEVLAPSNSDLMANGPIMHICIYVCIVHMYICMYEYIKAHFGSRDPCALLFIKLFPFRNWRPKSRNLTL